MAAQLYDLFFGSTNAGLAPTFSTFVNDDTGAALAPPAITDIGGGFYRFGVDWSLIGATNIRYAAGPLNGVEVADTITSNPAPGSVSLAVRPQNLALFPTAKTVLNRAATQCGFAQVADPYASTDPAFLVLQDLLISLSDDLQTEHDWTNLIQPATFVTDGVTNSYTLPVDFHEIVDQTLWNRSTRLPGMGPLSPQQVAVLQARLVNIVLNVTYQIAGGLLVFPIIPAAGATIAFSYISTRWVQSASSGTPDKDRPTASTDILLFDEELLVAGLKLRFDENKGFDTTMSQARFNQKLEHCIGKNDPGPVLSLGRGTQNPVDRMLDGRNVPEGGWGQ